MSRFQHYPGAPAAEAVRNAFTILCSAHDAASSFLDIFEATRTTRKAKGTPTDEEQDLLRAMLVFAGAGLDSMIKQLVRDALSLTIDRSKGAEENLKVFISKRLARQDRLDPSFLSSVLASRDPSRRPRGKAVMIRHTTEILRLANAFLIEVDRGLSQAPVGPAA